MCQTWILKILYRHILMEYIIMDVQILQKEFVLKCLTIDAKLGSLIDYKGK